MKEKCVLYLQVNKSVCCKTACIQISIVCGKQWMDKIACSKLWSQQQRTSVNNLVVMKMSSHAHRTIEFMILIGMQSEKKRNSHVGCMVRWWWWWSERTTPKKRDIYLLSSYLCRWPNCLAGLACGNKCYASLLVFFLQVINQVFLSIYSMMMASSNCWKCDKSGFYTIVLTTNWNFIFFSFLLKKIFILFLLFAIESTYGWKFITC